MQILQTHEACDIMGYCGRSSCTLKWYEWCTGAWYMHEPLGGFIRRGYKHHRHQFSRKIEGHHHLASIANEFISFVSPT